MNDEKIVEKADAKNRDSQLFEEHGKETGKDGGGEEDQAPLGRREGAPPLMETSAVGGGGKVGCRVRGRHLINQ